MGGLPYISYSGIINTNHLCQNLVSIPEAHQKTGLASRPGLKCGMRLTMRRPREASFTDASWATVRVIRTDEELMIAHSVCRALGLGMAGERRNSDPATKYSFWLDPFSTGGGSHNS